MEESEAKEKFISIRLLEYRKFSAPRQTLFGNSHEVLRFLGNMIDRAENLRRTAAKK